MRTRFLAVIVLCFSVTVFASSLTGWGTSPRTRGAAPQEPGDQTSLKARAKKVKAKGQNKAVFASPLPIYAETSGMDEASSTYLIVVARPLEATTVLASPDKLTTFQKFEILDRLSTPAARSCCGPKASDLPTSLAAPGPNEIYVRMNGGKAVIEDVEVTQEAELKFNGSEEYLLFLLPDESGVISTVPLGPYGVFRLKGDNLESVLDYPHTLDNEIKSKHGQSLGRLKAGLKGGRGK